MNITGDSGVMDSTKFLDYIKTRFASDLATMLATRDELAARQGSLTAATEAIAARKAAQDELASAKAAAENIMATTRADRDATQKLKQDLASAVESAKAERALLESSKTEHIKTKAAEEHQFAAKAAANAAKEAELIKRETALSRDRAALDARIEAFKVKVSEMKV